MRALHAFLLALASLPAVAGAEPGAAEPARVVASIQPLALIAEEIAGEEAVHVLVPPGASPHAFSPRPSDLRQVEGAAVLFRAGHEVDSWSARLAPDARAERVSLEELSGAAPHAWLDPLFVRDAAAPALARALAAANPGGGAETEAALLRFQTALDSLDAEIRELLAAAPGRRFVAFHAAWAPFAARYGLEEIAVVEEAPGEKPGPRALARLVEAAREAGVSAILVEPQLDPRLAEVIAREFGGGTVQVDPLGDPSDPERASYVALMRYNARAFLRALGGHPPRASR